MTDMIVSGAGNAGLNGTYIEISAEDFVYGGAEGDYVYQKQTGGGVYYDYYIYKGLNKWWIDKGDGTESTVSYWYSVSPSNAPATPDLVTEWEGYPATTPPAPTVTAASSGQNLTLTCAAGSYSLTGTDITLTAASAKQEITLTCDAGSFALTGTSVTFKQGITLSVLVDAMVVSGAGTSAVNGTYADDGIYHSETVGDGKRYKLVGAEMYLLKLGQIWVFSTVGGSDETWAQVMNDVIYYSDDRDKVSPELVVTWNISALGTAPVPTIIGSGVGRYTLFGSALTLKQASTLPLDAGSYSLTGTDITITAGTFQRITLACDAGSYALTGTAANLKQASTVALNSGAYSLTGSDVGLSAGIKLTCDAGSYALTGSDLTFKQASTLALEAGSYALTGTNTAFTIGAKLACNAGSYALTGTDAMLRWGTSLALSAGSYSLTGTGADFWQAARIALEAGGYTLIGSDVNLRVHYGWVVTPTCRTLVILAENRVYAIPLENRTRTIEHENRIVTIDCGG